MENKIATAEPYAPVIVKLLQGAIYKENQRLWTDLLMYQIPVTQYFEKLAIELIVDRNDGYAFLKQLSIDEDSNTIGLVRRFPMRYELSMLCVLLRMLIDDFESTTNEQLNLYISHKRLKEELEMFFKEKANKVKMLNELDKYIEDVERLDFLKRISKEETEKDEIQYEVRRIIKAKITNDVLEEFKRKQQNDVSKL
jgi:hypothetical protein